MKKLIMATLATAAILAAGLTYSDGEEPEEEKADTHHEMTDGTGQKEGSGHTQGGGDHGGMGHSSWASPEEAASRVNPVKATEVSIARGKTVYQANCVSCHGVEAKGDGPLAESLSPTPPDLAMMAPMHPAGDLAWKIETGLGAMPAWKTILSGQAIWDTVNYLKSLGGAGSATDGGHHGGQQEHGHGPGGHDSAGAETQKEGHGSSGHGSEGATPSGHHHEPAASDPGSEAIAAIADQLHAALSSGDIDTVRSLLAPDILIYESGNAETSLEEYASHHMPADMAFLAAMDKTLLSRQVLAGTDMAVVNSRSRLSGSYRDEDLDIVSTETLVLQQTGGVWRIIHAHWSSNP